MDSRQPVMRSMADPNITPLIDVMLVLLIIFMVVTPLATPSLDASLPRESGGSVGPVPLVIEVTRDSLSLNQAALPGLADLDEQLRAALATRSDRTVFVRAEGEGLRYSRFVDVIDCARGAGAQRIGIMGASPEPAPDSRR